MLSKPRDLDPNDLLAALAHWGLAGVELEYLPVGFGSHHWCADDGRGMRRFVTVDDLEAGFQAGPDTDSAFEALERAYRTAGLLRTETDLEFVVAPLADDEGRVLRRVSGRYAVTVLPLVQGESGAFGPYESPDQRQRVAVVLGRLHAATGAVPSDLPRRDDFALPSRGELEDALRRLDRPWSSGPFAEPARALLRANAASVGRHLADYDDLVAHVRASTDPWVVTHGEPHRANVLFEAGGGVYLVDWDTTLLAPRERDLRMVLDDEFTGWDDYVSVAGACNLSEEALELYRRWWDLADIAIYVRLFRRAHEWTDDTEASLENLTASLSTLV